MNQTSFSLVPFENPNGTRSWRLSGWLNGIRIRRNFKRREEAAAEKASLELKALHATSGLRVVACSLRDDQMREAEAVFKRLEGKPHPLTPDAIHMDTSLIHITCEISKVREPRKITIQPNLAAWLQAYPLTKYPVIVADFKKRREKFKDAFQLTHDVMRHTFISMFVAKFRSIGEAALQAGNSETIIRKHYLDLKSKEEAEEFFSIVPKRAGI